MTVNSWQNKVWTTKSKIFIVEHISKILLILFPKIKIWRGKHVSKICYFAQKKKPRYCQRTARSTIIWNVAKCYTTHTRTFFQVNLGRPSILNHFRDTASYLSKFIDLTLPNLHLALLLGVTPFKFLQDHWHQKTRVPGLSCSVVCVFLSLAILVEHRLVTDRQTDTGPWHIPREQSSCGKKCHILVLATGYMNTYHAGKHGSSQFLATVSALH